MNTPAPRSPSRRPSDAEWPPGAGRPAASTAGIAAGLFAGALWGLVFVAPVSLPGFGPLEVAVGRFLACGLLGALVLAWRQCHPQTRWKPAWRHALAALVLGVLGYIGYYALLVASIRLIGPVLPTLIIGTIPLALMVLGKPQGLRWRSLAPGLALTVAGLSVMVMLPPASGMTPNPEGSGANAPWGAGVALAVTAMASWTVFSLGNARWLRQNPDCSATAWASWLAVGAGVGALMLALVTGMDPVAWLYRPDGGRFVAVCVLTGMGAGWVATVAWNVASRHLSPSLAGQLVVSETVFGVVYAYLWFQRWPHPAEALACVLFVLGIVASVRAHP